VYENEDQTILRTIEDIYQSVCHTDRRLALSDNLLDDLAIDSLRSLELMLELEAQFPDAPLFSDNTRGGVSTVGDLVELLSEAEVSQR
jgi:acyl carrier protein